MSVVRLTIFCSALALSLCCCHVASARNLFVDNTAGDDRANGRTPTSSLESGPVRTIARALTLSEPGDHIVLAATGQPYRESVSLSGGNHSGFSVRPFTIVGNGAVLDGSEPVPPKSWEPVRENLYRFRTPRGGYHRLFLDGKPATRVPVDSAVGRLPPMQPRQWCSHAGYIYLTTDKDKHPREYPLSYAALPVGISLYQVKNVVVLDRTVQGFQTDGVNAHDSARNARLGGMILRGNGRSGLAVGGSSTVEADGCLIGDNGESQVNLSGYGTLSLQLCDLLDATAPKILRRGGRLFIDGVMQE